MRRRLRESAQHLSSVSSAQATGWAAIFKPKASTRDMCKQLWKKLENKAQEEGISLDLLSERPQSYRLVGQGKTLSYLLRLGHIGTLFLLSDEPKR